MCHNRMLGFHVVRSTVPTLHLWPQFTVANKSRIERNPEHKQRAASYPDPQYYCNQMQYYFFRNEELRHPRAAYFFRYYTQHETVSDRQAPALRTDENTIGENEGGQIPNDPAHRNVDALSTRYVEAGRALPCARALHVHVAGGVATETSACPEQRS